MRVQFEFSEEAIKESDALRSRLNVKSRGEILNHGVGLLKWLTNEHAPGSRILLKKKDDSLAEAVFPQLETLLNNRTEE